MLNSFMRDIKLSRWLVSPAKGPEKALDFRKIRYLPGGSLIAVVVATLAFLPGCNLTPISSNADAASASILVSDGQKRAQQGDYRGAIDSYDRAIAIDGANPEAHAHRGFARLGLGDAQGGESDLQQALRLRIDEWSAMIARKPNDVQTLLRRGLGYSDLGEYRAAIVDYDRIVRLQPENAQAYYLRGNAKYQLGSQRAAIADYDRALQLDPGLLPGYLARAKAHEVLGNHEAAAADFKAAQRIVKNDQVH
jgi:tetratricopeptide (TPR) repeat protein